MIETLHDVITFLVSIQISISSLHPHSVTKIGRASCRERVQSSVVGVALTNKRSVGDVHKAGHGDRWADHETLYTGLTTLCKLFAPVIPFVSEALFQSLRTASDQESIDLCDFPQVDPALVDDALSADMDALLELVSLGGAARNVAKVKFRQPLAEFRVQTTDDAARRALKRFPAPIPGELNVKPVTLHESTTPLP